MDGKRLLPGVRIILLTEDGSFDEAVRFIHTGLGNEKFLTSLLLGLSLHLQITLFAVTADQASFTELSDAIRKSPEPKIVINHNNADERYEGHHANHRFPGLRFSRS